MNKFVFIIILLIFSAAYGENYDNDIIKAHVLVDGFRSNKGYCFFLIFKDKKGFPESEKQAAFILKNMIDEKSTAFEFDIRPGIYAISVFHDENLNEKLDKTWYGKPVEGFGFSNNPKINFGAPSFRESSISLNEKNNSLRIKINYY